MLRKTLKRILMCLLGFLFSYALAGNGLPVYKFKRLTTLNGLPSNDIQKIYQGKDGYIWMASKNGLYQYDGYTFKVFKSNLYHPNLLSNNNILCLEEDYEHRIWIGTHKGLNMLDRKTGQIRQINRKEFINNSISTILATKSGQLLFGTDQGLYQYIYETDSCILYGRNNTDGILPETSIKSILEDSYGHIWIGTWNHGLFRYDPEKNKYYSYPRMNEINSAHVLFEDSRKRIWVGTWGGGLQLLENAYDVENVKWKTFLNRKDNPNSILHNIIYDICEDINSKKIWIGTTNGLSILTDEEQGIFTNYFPGKSEETISDNEVNSLICDSQGMIWLGLLRGGINMVSTRKAFFKSHTLDFIKEEMKTNSVTNLFIDEEDNVMWLGIGNAGLVQYDRNTHKYKWASELEGFSSLTRLPSIMAFTKLSSNGQIWIGTYNTGIYVYDKKKKGKDRIKIYETSNTPWLTGDRVYCIYEDDEYNKWMGTNYGMSMLAPDGHYLRLDSLECEGRRFRSAVIIDIKSGPDKELWVASNNNGVYRISGRGDKLSDYALANYSVINGKLNSVNVSCIHIDAKGRIWAGGEGGGLSLYDKEQDSFVPVHLNWNLPGDAIFNILEDKQGNLWMGTNTGLIKLNVGDDLQTISYRLYTTSDGLLDNFFTRKGAAKAANGEFFFGSYQGLNSFYPEKLLEDMPFMPPVVITDLKIHNCSWDEIDEKRRNNISKLAPEFTKRIRLNYKNNNFNIEFSILGYETPMQHMYAYKLEGMDEQWQYTSSSRRFAYYNNLKPGTYQFKLKGTNANGVWSDHVANMEVVILPPPWETWWAYIIYAAIIVMIVVFVYRMMSNRLKLQNELQFREIEKAKAEEVNHAKLQFFTNITHELLTPLTIISASVDELRMQMPQHAAQYQVMTSNINRLIRLLQQILEFRKAETGNLKLKVSRADLSAFVSNSVESFRPLIKKKQMNFSVSCLPEPFPAWFDPDKVDKILYNLLSNAAKYNKAGGKISIELKEDKVEKCAILIIADDGEGMSKEAQKDLFRRFYEGDYRKFKTIGTGIGLSLTKDLVTLHGGEITVESEEGTGTRFKVKLPIYRGAFKEEEIDDTTVIAGQEEVQAPVEFCDDELDAMPEDMGNKYRLLLIEDNEDLLQLMVKLLGVEYAVFTATNGQEGLDVVREEDIDLVVSDIMMPVMDGIEFCKEVKNNFETCHIPILLLTAKNSEADRANAYESGADSFLNKPFNLTVLHARINNLLKARERMNRDFKKQLVFEAKELNYTSIDEEFLQKAIDCVHSHLDDPEYDQAQFVEDMGTSRSTLFRKMKSLTGLSYVSFIRNVRLKAACQIMEEKKNVRISELAYAVGFNDPRYFSTCFKKEFGMQPREYFDRFVMGQDKNHPETSEDVTH
ncbi:hybrid sensor histidine kinase/response regulator transcription factor [Bacteroides sp.]